jgi:hypothetical protein
MDVNLKHYSLRDFKNIYSEMSNLLKDYSKLNHRNRKKDDAHLYKHAMHLIRLLITGRDILAGEGIKTYREKERQLLLDIRMGKYTFDEIFDLVEQHDSEFKKAAAITDLPEKPDKKKVQGLMMDMYGGI